MLHAVLVVNEHKADQRARRDFFAELPTHILERLSDQSGDAEDEADDEVAEAEDA